MSKTKPQPKVETPPPKVSAHVREVQIHFIILGIVFIAGLALSWRCWPDPIVDFGHELYIPWRLNIGDVPYRDIELVTGPASQLYHASLFKTFGTSFTVLIWSNLLLLVLLLVVLYDELASLSRRWVAFVALLFFITVFAFGQYTTIGNYNYLSPYRHEITHGILVGIIGLWAIRRAGLTSKLLWYFIAGVCCGSTVAMKTEISVPLLGAFAWWGLVTARTVTFRDILRRKSAFLAGLVLPLFACWLELQVRGLPAQTAFESIFASWSYSLRPELTRGAKFYSYVGGWNALSQNSVDITTTIIILTILIATFLWLDRWITRSLDSKTARRATCVVLGILAFVLGGRMLVWNYLIPTLPALLLLFISISTVQLLKPRRNPSPAHFEQWRTWGLWAVYSFLCTLKMLFLLRIPHYGFALAMPATLLGIALLLHFLPETFGLNSPPDNKLPPGGRLWKTITISLLVGGMFCHFATSARTWAAKQASLGTGDDLFWGDNHHDRRIVALQRTYDFLKREMQTKDTLAVIPDGTMLNYVLRKRNPTPYLLVGPWDIRAAGGDPVVTSEFNHSPPQWIVVISDDPTIHGTGQFGASDYGEKLASWIRRHYTKAIDIQEPSAAFGGYSLSILKHRQAPPASAPPTP